MHQSTGSASLFATDLGPTQPRVDPGHPFPLIPAPVNSPVDVTLNGKPAEVVAAVGPGAVDGYQVNFRAPADTAIRLAAIRVSAAWIAGTPSDLDRRMTGLRLKLRTLYARTANGGEFTITIVL
jgi:uncharacterized protein (TIGR03437 family)